MLLLCTAYVLAGFVGRDPWRDVDIAAFGYMREIASGHTHWLTPTLAGLPPADPGLLQYWLGAWALQAATYVGTLLAPAQGAAWVAAHADTVVRLPFIAALTLALACAWRAFYGLARMPGAQPVAFAFGGEASPKDYARALADGGLLALLACLGLAQMGHETSHTLVQLSAVCIALYALCNLWWQPLPAAIATFAGPLALALAGAPGITLGLGLLAAVAVLGVRSPRLRHRHSWAAWWLLCTAVATCTAWMLGQWRPTLINPWTHTREWTSLWRLLLWFTWPVWPLALWTLWRWRKQLTQPRQQPHLFIPLGLAALGLAATVFTTQGGRALLLGLPGVAGLAAFALPTLRRSLGALVDWLTLVFFTLSALTIWVVWVSVQTGFPAKPAANVARLAPGFVPHFGLFAFLVAVVATVGWLLLVAWRTRRHRPAIWTSLALPAGGTTLGWVLLMTLWLPMLDYGRSHAPHIRRLVQAVEHAATTHGAPTAPSPTRTGSADNAGCVQLLGLSRAQISALRFHTTWDVRLPGAATDCQWTVATPEAWQHQPAATASNWHEAARITRPTERRDHLLVLHRTPPAPSMPPGHRPQPSPHSP